MLNLEIGFPKGSPIDTSFVSLFLKQLWLDIDVLERFPQ